MLYTVTITKKRDNTGSIVNGATFQEVANIIEYSCDDNQSVDSNEMVQALSYHEMQLTYQDLAEGVAEFFNDNPNGFIVTNRDTFDEFTPEDGGWVDLGDVLIKVRTE